MVLVILCRKGDAVKVVRREFFTFCVIILYVVSDDVNIVKDVGGLVN